jgi:hypothetical protein
MSMMRAPGLPAPASGARVSVVEILSVPALFDCCRARQQAQRAVMLAAKPASKVEFGMDRERQIDRHSGLCTPAGDGLLGNGVQ